LILAERQRDEDVEVVRIVADKGSVDLLCQGTNRATVRLQTATNLPVPAVVLEDAGLNAVLDLFARFTNRTLLRWPALPKASFSMRAAVKDRAGAAQILAQALVAKELSIIPDGEKFLMIVPNSKAAVVKPHSPSAKASAGSGTKTQATPAGMGGEEQEALLPGMIDFRNTDVAQVLPIYAEIVHRKLEPGRGRSAHGTITLTSQNRLTFEEAAYAVETVLRWSGIKLVPVGEDKLKAVPVREN
jgi:hypothetical protein